MRFPCLLIAIALFALHTSAQTNSLTGQSAQLYTKARGGYWFSDAIKLKPEIVPTSDGKSFLVIWKATPEPKHWIVSLHGTQGFATDDLAVWHPHLQNRDIGLVCLQWWLGSGDGPADYYSPSQAYHEIDAELKKLNIKPGTGMLHGFSRGSANSYAIAALDAGRGQHWFSLFVASSGGASTDYPPNRSIVNGGFGERPLKDTHWILAAGGRDPNPERDGIPAMKRTATWLKDQGAVVVEIIADQNGGHGALQHNTANMRHVLDLFLNERR